MIVNGKNAVSGGANTDGWGGCPACAAVPVSPDAFPQLLPTVYRPSSTHARVISALAPCC